MLTIESKIVNKSWARTQISFKTMSFWSLFLDLHLPTHHSNIVVWWRCVTKLGPLTFEISVLHLSNNKWSFWERYIKVLPLKTWAYTQVLMHCLIKSLFVWFQLGIVANSRILWSKQSSRRKSFPSVKLRQVISRSPEQAHKCVGRHVIYWHQEHVFRMSIPAKGACESADRSDNSSPCHLTLSMHDIELHIDKLLRASTINKQICTMEVTWKQLIHL